MATIEPPSRSASVAASVRHALAPLGVEHTAVDQLLAARARAENDLLFAVAAQAATAETGTAGYGFENIVGVGLGERLHAGRPTGQPSVTVYVVEKADETDVDPEALVPESFEGVPTDVVESGEFVAQPQRGRHRPAAPGVSLAHHASTAGTFGFLARRSETLYVVSNNHVLAQENAADRGDAILQPSPSDGGGVGDELATLADWIPLDFGAGANPVDCAIAEVADDAAQAEHLCFARFPVEPADAGLSTVVRKCGRTTGLTRGMVSDVAATVRLGYTGGKVALMTEQILVRAVGGQSFSAGGDSGSLVVEEQTRRPLGLLCGGGPQLSVVNRIGAVLDALGLSFAE